MLQLLLSVPTAQLNRPPTGAAARGWRAAHARSTPACMPPTRQACMCMGAWDTCAWVHEDAQDETQLTSKLLPMAFLELS